jgi:serine-type D-Ala-D-Ala carboxypeptidase/endopeptidase
MNLRAPASLSLGLVSLAAVACGGSPAAPPASPAPVASTAPPASAAPAPPPPSASGIWLGTLHAGKNLRVQLRLDLEKTPPACTIDSLDQHSGGIPCTASVTGSTLSLDVPAVHGSLQGTLSADGNTLNATWTQGMPQPLVMTRQASAIEVTPAPMDPAMPPVDVAKLEDVLDKDIAGALANGELAQATDGGVTIGVVQHGVRRVFSYGTAKPDSVFEIGSITKTFTGLLLAQEVQQKKARLDEPVRALLPAGTVAAPASGPEITLVDLSAQHSGLPRMPDNFKPADETNPYADYDKKALYAFIGSHGVAMPAKPEFLYSNLGVGLLGQALADRAGTTYETLLHKEITGPLGMRDTVITLTPALRARFIAGHDGEHKPAHAWDLDAFAGAGGIRSTAADMLTYLDAQLHPDKLPRTVSATPEGKTLAAALAASHVVQGEADRGMHIALNWLRVDATGSFWHNGATGGYSAFAIFNPDADYAVVVLYNTSIGNREFADELGTHVAQRLTGKPAVPLGPESQ